MSRCPFHWGMAHTAHTAASSSAVDTAAAPKHVVVVATGGLCYHWWDVVESEAGQRYAA